MFRPTHRAWVSPLSLIGFLIISLTGVAMFFHVRLHAITVLHELTGLAFVILGVIHVLLNWPALMGHLKHRRGLVALAIGIALCTVLALLAALHDDHESGGRHDGHGHYGETREHAD